MLQKQLYKNFKKQILIFVLTFICSISYSQEFKNIGIENGLSSHQAFDVVQDKNGFIWVSTKGGIDRYDGENVVNYNLPEQNGSHIFQRISLTIDKEKNVWAYTFNGEIYQFIEGKNRFELEISIPKIINSQITISDLIINKTFWLSSNKGLYIYDLKDQKLTKLPDFKDERISLVLPYKNNELLVALSDKVVVFNRSSGISDTIFENGIQYGGIRSFYWDKTNNEVWIGTRKGEVFIYDCITTKVFNLNESILELPSFPINKIVSSNEIVFIGSDGGGVFKIDKKRKILIEIFRENEDVINSLSGNGVQDLYISNSGNLLITIFTGGLNILNNKIAQFHVLRHEINNTNSLRNNVVSNILEDNDGDLWFATNNGISCWLKSKRKWIHFLDGRDRIANVFLSLFQYDNKSIMAGSYSKGIYVIDKTKGIINHILPGRDNPNKEDNADYVVEIYRDNDDKIWTGGPFKEMAIYNPRSKQYHYLPLTGVNSIQTKDKEHIFIGTPRGLYVANIYTFEFYKENFEGSVEESIFINSLNYDQQNSILWIATSSAGIIKWNPQTKQVQKFDVNNGLPSNHVYAILRHSTESIWASTEKGLIKNDLNDGSIESYSLKDGLSDESFYKNSKLRANNGDLYFGSYQGVTYFNPDNIKSKNENVKLYLGDLLINNRIIHTDDDNTPLKSCINETDNLILKYNQNSFSFGFTSIASLNSGKTRYSWKLEGQDEEWAIPSSNNTANYTNLEEGKYTFQLRAIGNKSDEVLDERLINIIVKPAPWNTIWANLLYFVILASIIAAITKYLKISGEKRLSDSKIQFFINTAHDIKTPLTLASAPLYDLQKSKYLGEHDRYYLGLSISSLEKLTDSVNHLLDFQKSDLGKSQLTISKVDIVRVIEDKIAYFSPVAENKNIKVAFISDLGVLNEWVDITKFEDVLNNLLSNAFKYTQKDGVVTVKLTSTEKNWYLLIKDTGIGIPVDAQKNLFKRYFRGKNVINSKISGTGIGLLLARNYVLLHKGKIDFESTEGVGTEFTLTFFRGKNHFDSSDTFFDSPEVIRTDIFIDENITEPQQKLTGRKMPKLLIVEDNDNLRNYLNNSMARYYQTKTAENGKVALDLVEKYMPDIIVSDVGMPEMNGIELTNQLKSEYETSHIPIILLTAFTEKNDIVKGLQTGADDYITKPFDVALLLIRIENILKNRQLIRDRFIRLTENKLEEGTYTNKRDQEFVQKAIAFVEKNITNPNLSKQYFAQEMFVSQTVLYQKLKMLTDQSPSEFIKVIKLRNAVKILNERNYCINEIAALAGFSDSKYFSTCFKKFFGKSPSRYLDEQEVKE